MLTLVDFINSKTNDAFNFLKLVDITYSKSKKECTVLFIYPENVPDLTTSQKQEITKATQAYLDINAKLTVKINKSYLSLDLILKFIFSFFKEHFVSIADNITNDTVSCERKDDTINIVISVDSFIKDYFLKHGIESALRTSLTQNFCGKFFITLNVTAIDEDFYENYLQERGKRAEMESIATSFVVNRKKRFKINVTKKLIGDEILINPEHITLKPALSVIVAGKISNVSLKTFKSKKMVKDKDGTEHQLEKPFFRFKLKDGSTLIDGVYFPTKATMHKMNLLLDKEETVVIKGNIDQFNERFSLNMHSLSLCQILEEIEDDIVYKQVSPEYLFVNPKNYVETEQINFLAAAPEINKAVLSKTFVVFDLETTGMNADSEEIVEIGAVKIIDGKITQTFETFVKPNKHIPGDATEIHGITDEMVANAPTINKVLPDFYKFTRGADLVAHNSDFDCSFIYSAAKKLSYNFDNKVLDTLAIARKQLPQLGNHKLITICNHLKIPLIGAHRAVNDTIATAKVFLKLYK